MFNRRIEALAREVGAHRGTRRGLVAVLALLLGGRRAAAQNTSSCAAQGQMCALGMPCCSGSVCQSSYVNPTFGYCVTGTDADSNGTGFSYPGATPASTTTSTEKGPGGRRHRIAERKRDRDRQRRKRKGRRRERTNNRNNNNGNNGGNGQSFTDDYMVSASMECSGIGPSDRVTIRNTGSQTLSIAQIRGRESQADINPALTVLDPNEASVFFNAFAQTPQTDFFRNTTTEYAIITAWRGDGSSQTPGNALVFRAYCNGKKTKRVK